MGTSLVNFHVRGKAVPLVRDAFKELRPENAWIAEGHEGWVTLWDFEASSGNTDRIRQICEHISARLDCPVISFLVHDSDVFRYWLYENGQCVDEYDSWPACWVHEPVDEESLAANVELLVRHCRSAVKLDDLQSILVQRRHADIAGGNLAYVFAEKQLWALAPLLGIDTNCAATDFIDLGRDVDPAEVGAEWIGTNRPPGSQT